MASAKRDLERQLDYFAWRMLHACSILRYFRTLRSAMLMWMPRSWIDKDSSFDTRRTQHQLQTNVTVSCAIQNDLNCVWYLNAIRSKHAFANGPSSHGKSAAGI